MVRNLDKIWKSEDISKDTKVLLRETSVLSLLIYNSETWMLIHKQKLRAFEMSVLRRIYRVTKKDRKRIMWTFEVLCR